MRLTCIVVPPRQRPVSIVTAGSLAWLRRMPEGNPMNSGLVRARRPRRAS